VLEALSVGRPVLGWAHGGVGELLARWQPDGGVAPFDEVLLLECARQLLAAPPAPVTMPDGLRAMQQATLALYDIVRRNAFDLVVLDTPPTANALDFLEAPRRLAEAISSPAIQWFARPAGEQGGRFSLSRLRSGSTLVLKRLAKFVGSQFLEDIAAFLTDFQTVLGGFLERAESVNERLRRPDVAFLLVLAPETPAVDEALYFEQRLRASGIRLSAFLINRVHQRPGLSGVDDLAAHLRGRPELSGLSDLEIEQVAAPLSRSALETLRLCDGEDQEVERLRAASPGTTLLRVPLLSEDAAPLTTLNLIARCLDVPGG